MRIHRTLKAEEADLLGIEIKKRDSRNRNPRYYITPEDSEYITELRSTPNKREFIETQKKFDKSGNVISSVQKLQSKPIETPEGFEIIKISTSKTTGQQWVQYKPKEIAIEDEVKEIDFEGIIKKHITPIKHDFKAFKPTSFVFDRLVFTDVHIGMETNKNGYSLYGGKWDESEIVRRLDVMINHTLENKRSNVLIIDELGDFMDGWDGETVRKGHKLPQNMDNEKAFDVGIRFKTHLIDSLAPHYDRIVCNNITNDNHAGSFSYVVNSSFEMIMAIRYKHVIVNNIRKFIDHYVFGNNCFILTHGKDGHNLKFGFKPILDTKQIEKIENYINQHKLQDYNIEFSKGDSHQKIFDESTSDSFDYYNYGAFSPSSEWVQTNFKKGCSFFEFFSFKENGQKTHAPYKFKWNTNREEKTVDYSVTA